MLMASKRNMNYQQVPINKLREDKNQPRRLFNKEKIAEMAETIKSHGVINPIEIDDDFVIVTGAMRYRAAKEAGVKELPVKVLGKLPPKERYIRQAVENLQRDDLSETENFDVVEKLRKMFPEKSQRELGRMIGK